MKRKRAIILFLFTMIFLNLFFLSQENQYYKSEQDIKSNDVSRDIESIITPQSSSGQVIEEWARIFYF